MYSLHGAGVHSFAATRILVPQARSHRLSTKDPLTAAFLQQELIEIRPLKYGPLRLHKRARGTPSKAQNNKAKLVDRQGQLPPIK
jgi:hypothetical protein